MSAVTMAFLMPSLSSRSGTLVKTLCRFVEAKRRKNRATAYFTPAFGDGFRIDIETVTVSTHARYQVARICIPAGWLRWWRLFIDLWVPKRKPGRPLTEAVDTG